MPSAWIAHVKAVYQARKKKEAGYKYSSAMKDARATYKRKGEKAEEKAEPAPKAKAKAKRKKAPKKKAAKGNSSKSKNSSIRRKRWQPKAKSPARILLNKASPPKRTVPNRHAPKSRSPRKKQSRLQPQLRRAIHCHRFNQRYKRPQRQSHHRQQQRDTRISNRKAQKSLPNM